MTDAGFRVTPQALEAAAKALSATHWDGTGCGTNGAMGCSHCFGPSPADAHEVSRTVLAAAAPLLCQPLQEENQQLRQALAEIAHNPGLPGNALAGVAAAALGTASVVHERCIGSCAGMDCPNPRACGLWVPVGTGNPAGDG